MAVGAGEGNLGQQALGRFDELAGSGDYIDPQIPAQDFEDLQSKTKIVREWVNTSVAHLDPKGKPLGGLRLPAIHDAVDVVADLFEKYNVLIAGELLHSGVIMDYRPTVFRVKWIPDEDHYLRVLEKLDEAEKRRVHRNRNVD